MQNCFLNFFVENRGLNVHLLLDEEYVCINKLTGYNQYSLKRCFNISQCGWMFIHIDFEAALCFFLLLDKICSLIYGCLCVFKHADAHSH
jgi:hypothetical protein